MKVLVVLSAVLAGCLANPSIGYQYSAIAPLTGYDIAAPYSYAYSAPLVTPYAAHPIAPIVPEAPLRTQHHSQDELGNAKYGHSEPYQGHEAIQDAHGNKIGSYSYVDPHGGVHRTDYIADAFGYRATSNDIPMAPAAPLPLLHRRRRQTWNGPLATPAVTPSGHLADTPEVAAARAAHLTEHARQNNGAQPQSLSGQSSQSWNQAPLANYQPQPAARSWNQPAPSWQNQRSWNQAPTSWTQSQAAARSWNQAPAATWNHGPATFSNQAAQIQVTPSGNLADTPEVAAARASHFSEFARAASAAAAAPESQSDTGAYNPAQYSGAYNPAQDSGAYNPAQDSGAYNPAQNSGAYNPAQDSGAYNPAQDSGAYQPQTTSWNQQAAARSWSPAPAPAAATYSWNQPQSVTAQSWGQTRAAAQPWAQPQVAPQPWTQGQASTWNQSPATWDQSPSGGIPDTPEVAAAKAAHLAEHAAASQRQKRSLF